MAKQPSLTQSMSELHTWAGLVLGWVLGTVMCPAYHHHCSANTPPSAETGREMGGT